jgi:hypothetical protein
VAPGLLREGSEFDVSFVGEAGLQGDDRGRGRVHLDMLRASNLSA